MIEERLRWDFHHFTEIPCGDLYAALQLRQLVFVVEQKCVFLDADGLDATAWHLLGRSADGDDTLLAYARLFAPGDVYKEAAIGRVITHPSVRGQGHGRTLMREALDRVASLFPEAPVRISAQLHLERFYTSLGFTTQGGPFEDDGIPHIYMLRASRGAR